MQRVGRINRVDTKFDTIYTFNFFPTTQSNNELKLKEAAEAKINAFLTLLGGDAALLTEGEPIESHELFNRLNSKKTITGEDETETSELKYLSVIKEIRDQQPDLFEKIKRLPKKARSAKLHPGLSGSLLTYFRKGKVQKFYSTACATANELDFISAAQTMESQPDEKRQKLRADYFDLLDQNITAFVQATTEDLIEAKTRKGRDSGVRVLQYMKAVFKNTKQLTDDQEEYVKKVMMQLQEGALPKQTTKNALKVLKEMNNEVSNPLKVLAVLQMTIPSGLLESHYAEEHPRAAGKREVILSMYLAGESI